jgi:hypothetical protein
LLSKEVQAQEWTGGAGAFVGYAFGAREGVVWGFDIFGTRISQQESCSNEPRSGVGTVFRFGMIGVRDPRITLALHGGREFERIGPALTGEIGGTYRFADEGGFGLHLGLMPEYAIFNASARAELFLDEYAAVGGVRYLPTYGESSTCFVGRPLRGASALATVNEQGARNPSAHVASSDDGAEAKAAGRAWERDAQHECASVPAFLQLARELLVHDAPAHLVERALDAACDEIAHARLCADMASHLLGERVVPSLPVVTPRPVPTLTHLAAESWVDGCLGEGAAAKRAGRAAELARHRGARFAQGRIERDETRHAELAWDVLRWAVHRGGPDTRDAVHDLAMRALSPPRVRNGGLEAYGQLDPHHADPIFERHALACTAAWLELRVTA